MIVSPLLKFRRLKMAATTTRFNRFTFSENTTLHADAICGKTNLAGLTYHLSKFHGSEGRREPAIATEHINTRLHKTHGLSRKRTRKIYHIHYNFTFLCFDMIR